MAVGCNAILGLGDYKEGDGGVGADTGTDGGTPAYCVPYNGSNGDASGPFPAAPAWDGGLPQVGACIPAPPAPMDAGMDAAQTRPKCNAINANPVVYVTGTAKDFLAAMGRSLFNDAEPITLVWVGNSSCDVWNTMLKGTKPPNMAGNYWDSTGKQNACDLTLSDAGTFTFDVGTASVFADTCQPLPQGLPPDILRKDGPVQTMLFVVPKGSKQTSITRKAASQIYGYGAAAGIGPWTDENFIFRLADDSGTQNLIAAGIGVPANVWKGRNLDFTDCMLDYLASVATGNEEKIIAPLGYSNLNQLRATQSKPLAFQNDDQTCAYFPDSTESSKDKRNVRQGRYFLWGPTHVISRTNASPEARRVANILSGIELPPGGTDLVEIAVNTNLVPSCAMEVRREKEMGPLVPPDTAIKSCGCYFDRKATGSTTCKTCMTSADCATEATAKVCSYGYCEVR